MGDELAQLPASSNAQLVLRSCADTAEVVSRYLKLPRIRFCCLLLSFKKISDISRRKPSSSWQLGDRTRGMLPAILDTDMQAARASACTRACVQ